MQPDGDLINAFNVMVGFVSFCESVALLYFVRSAPGKKPSRGACIQLFFVSWMLFFLFFYFLLTWPVMLLVVEPAKGGTWVRVLVRSSAWAPVTLAGIAGTVWFWSSVFPREKQ